MSLCKYIWQSVNIRNGKMIIGISRFMVKYNKSALLPGLEENPAI